MGTLTITGCFDEGGAGFLAKKIQMYNKKFRMGQYQYGKIELEYNGSSLSKKVKKYILELLEDVQECKGCKKENKCSDGSFEYILLKEQDKNLTKTEKKIK